MKLTIQQIEKMALLIPNATNIGLFLTGVTFLEPTYIIFGGFGWVITLVYTLKSFLPNEWVAQVNW